MADAIHIRPPRREDAAALARIQVDSYRSAYAGIFPQDYLNQFSYDAQEVDWIEQLASASLDVILVAEAGDSQPAGYAVGRMQASYDAPRDSELVSLHVRRSLQRRGIGRRLVTALAASLAARGCRAMMLWVLEANPARAFYERLGAVPLEGRKRTITAYEVAYGWPDIQAIAAPGWPPHDPGQHP